MANSEPVNAYQDFSLARAGFLYSTGYYSHVAPLAQTGMLKDCGLSFPFAPGRAGLALRSK